MAKKPNHKKAEKPEQQAKKDHRTIEAIEIEVVETSEIDEAAETAKVTEESKEVEESKAVEDTVDEATNTRIDGAARDLANEIPEHKISEHARVEKSRERKARRQERRRRRAAAKHTMPAFLRVGLSILLLMTMSVFFTWFALWRQNLCDVDVTWEFVEDKPGVFLYSCMVIFCLMAVIAAITWRPFLTIGLSFSALSVLTFIHMQKFALRNEPLLPEDFQLADAAGTIAEFVDFWAIVRLAGGIILIMLGTSLLEFYARKVIGRDRRGMMIWNRWALVPRATWSLVALTTCVLVINPVLHRKNLEWINGLNLSTWNQFENYENNGIIVGFLFNLGSLDATEPEGYSEEAIQKIASKYQKIKQADTGRTPLGDIAENVIFVLDETFYDPALLTEYYGHFGGDVTPNLHAIFRNYPSGYMYSPVYGGGTANVEFEAQTGLSNFWVSGSPYVNSLTQLGSITSLGSWGKKSGFETVGLHAYAGAMYKRNIVYPIMGYDEFIDYEGMKFAEHENGSGYYYTDRAVYNEVLDIIESSDQPKTVAAITMQNHSPYANANYESLDFTLFDRPEDDWYAIESSFQSLHNADAYLGEFIDQLDELDEKTVMIWFGDHAMGMLERYVRAEDKTERDLAYLTPYFVYANFDIESPWNVYEVAEMNAEQGLEFPILGVDLPTTSPNCLTNTMYNILEAEKPTLFYLLDEVCAETPILTRSFFANSGRLPETKSLKEYELVNYDILAGEYYWPEK